MAEYLNRRARLALCGLIFLTLLSACGPVSETTGRVRASTPTSTQSAIAPISALPPGSDDRPLLPGQSGTEYMPSGLPALSPARGVNADLLFAEELKNEKARFDRLENAVADMRREFESIKPAIIRLSAVESDMQELLVQLQTLTGTPVETSYKPMPDIPMDPMPEQDIQNSDVTVVQMPIPSPPTAAPLQPEQAAATAHLDLPAVTDIREGTHDGLARLVLDVSAGGEYTHDLDNSEHVLMIELPDTAWSAAQEGTFKKSPLLKSWSAQPAADGKGSLVAIQLNGPATIVLASKLPGKDGHGSRIVIDLKEVP